MQHSATKRLKASTVLRNVVAVVVALALGSTVNLGLVVIGSALIPGPAGMDVTDWESIAASAPLLESRHYLFPFLAHALGTLAAALLVLAVAASHKRLLGWFIGLLFLTGGILNALLIPAPLWIAVADLLLAYLPMVWLAGLIMRLAPARQAGEALDPGGFPESQSSEVSRHG